MKMDMQGMQELTLEMLYVLLCNCIIKLLN